MNGDSYDMGEQERARDRPLTMWAVTMAVTAALLLGEAADTLNCSDWVVGDRVEAEKGCHVSGR